MIFVIELLNDGTANVFRSAANFITHDGTEQKAHRIFWSAVEAKQAHQTGADIFANWGPDGYRAFQSFETFLQGCGVLPKPPAPGRGRAVRPKRKVRPH